MTRRRRFLKIAKWTAAVMFVLSLSVWMFAARVNFDSVTPLAYIVLKCGSVGVWFHDINSSLGKQGKAHPNYTLGFRRNWDFGLDRPVGSWGNDNGYFSGVFALWLPTLLAFIAAVILFFLDRRRIPPGHCRCGYNLTGNTSGRCPECGTKLAPSIGSLR